MSSKELGLSRALEALLFIAARPLSVKKLASVIGAQAKTVAQELDELQERYAQERRGLTIVKSGTTYQMTSAKEVSKVVAAFNKEEVSGELTKPSLEALTIVAYRGPVKRAEIEQIRGVNCSIILRNLLIRGLIEEETKKGDIAPLFSVTTDFLTYIGLHTIKDLPEYESLSSNVPLEKFLGAALNAEDS